VSQAPGVLAGGALRAALAPLRRHAARDPKGRAALRYAAGLVLAAAGDKTQALHWLNAALACDPAQLRLRFSRAVVLDGAGYSAEAACELETLRPALPRSATLVRRLGAVLGRAGQVKAALALYQEAMSQAARLDAATQCYLLHDLSLALEAAGDTPGAIDCLRRAALLGPRLAAVHYNLGRLLVDRGEVDEAAEAFRRALAVDPGHSRSRNNLGVILLRRGSVADAIAHFERALAGAPDMASARQNLERARRLAATRPPAPAAAPPGPAAPLPKPTAPGREVSS